jgi:hypothetical protein
MPVPHLLAEAVAEHPFIPAWLPPSRIGREKVSRRPQEAPGRDAGVFTGPRTPERSKVARSPAEFRYLKREQRQAAAVERVTRLEAVVYELQLDILQAESIGDKATITQAQTNMAAILEQARAITEEILAVAGEADDES